LAPFKCSFEELKEGIINMNEDMLTIESTQALYASVPTDEEMENIKEFLKNNDQELLGKAEQFFIIVHSS
jgi:hypothetical protein